ncbi:MAG: hypothetical protein II932_03230, partial [Treponema sp.]|nr:hypothetical protein [Treponema sp.]
VYPPARQQASTGRMPLFNRAAVRFPYSPSAGKLLLTKCTVPVLFLPEFNKSYLKITFLRDIVALTNIKLHHKT